ncbi:DUF1980 domain-containing protein [Haloferula sp.]|uniref:TIGR03943 family putative permease subunit n=1 Tax=Haloferula sp. TaxID=2497595 RepID=UPI00329EE862
MKYPALQRCLLALALISWGGVLVYFHTSGRIAKYLAPDFRLIALAGGLGLIVVGLFNLLTSRIKASCGHDHGPDDAHDHESLDLHPLAAVSIMILPVWLCTAWTKDGFSIAALTRKGLNDTPAEAGSLFLSSVLPPLTKEIIEAQHPANADGYRTFPLMELFFSSADPEMRGLVGDMKIVTEGRLVPDPDNEHQFRLYRLFITCCAADSRPVPIIARFPDGAPEVEPNSWISLSGTITYPDEGEGHIPVLVVDFSTPKEAPMEESFMRGY